VDPVGSGQEPMAVSCEYGDEALGSRVMELGRSLVRHILGDLLAAYIKRFCPVFW
jgi:hypothetical protein